MFEFSVLMSLYIKETASNLESCLQSIIDQTVLPNEIVIVEDGPINEDVEKTLERYMKEFPNLFRIVGYEKNRGLGYALAYGVNACKNELIARMDTDDICDKCRFEKQLSRFELNPRLDVCGSYILEFENSTSNIVSQRKVPLTDHEIKKYQKRRDALNHMTVMFRKTAVLRAGNYQTCLLMEDTLLWINMILTGSVFENIPEYLVYARVGDKMFERRGGYQYFKLYRQGRKRVLDTGYISRVDYYYTLVIQFIVAIIPNNIRGWIYKHLLHA